MSCSNCDADFDSTKSGIVTTQKGAIVTSVCDGCLEGARVIKLVLRKGDVGHFTYEQFSTIETLKPFPSEHAGKGLSTPIGQSKR